MGEGGVGPGGRWWVGMAGGGGAISLLLHPKSPARDWIVARDWIGPSIAGRSTLVE